METIQKNTGLETKSHSKLDNSGTDPNRYSSYYSDETAEALGKPKKSKSSILGIEPNVSTLERIVMITAGSYMLYKAFSGKNKSTALGVTGGTMLARGISGYCPVYDYTEKHGLLKSSNVNIRTTVTIHRPVSEVYAFWRKFENLPKFMKHLESVKEIDAITSEWKAKGPGGIGSLSWNAEILMDEKDRLLSWHSLPDATVSNAGKVYFRDIANNSTELDVTISYHAPLGIAGEAAAKLLNPMFEKMVISDIENLKSFLETGQHTTTV